jgi:hypothetical protein
MPELPDPACASGAAAHAIALHKTTVAARETLVNVIVGVFMNVVWRYMTPDNAAGINANLSAPAAWFPLCVAGTVIAG